MPGRDKLAFNGNNAHGSAQEKDTAKERNSKRTSLADVEAREIAELELRVARSAPPPGQLDTKEGKSKFAQDFALSKATLRGLARGKFTTATEIQKQVLPHALAGRDVLGAAKTGSGKTLAFVIPLVDDLFRNMTSRDDGVVGLVISPTRELALQIHEVVKVVTHAHAFTSGLLVGGTDFAQEQKAAVKIQIAICAPGRLLQHLEQTPLFDVSSQLRVLVLDEADRLLDLGFQHQLEAILSYLPKPRRDGGSRQTMLFSATQTKSVKDLAKLSLREPEFISVHASASQPTPISLKQLYVVCELGDKLDVVYSFIRSHLHTKSIIFFSSCKQVKFVEACFRHMRPGVPVMCLHGKQTSAKRTFVYESFCAKPHAVLFATDIASRGLDFPDVDWVVQADCPEDVAAYIHRVGRTARYKKGGNALCILLPSEEKGFLGLLQEKNIPIKRLGMNPNKKQSIQEKLRGYLVADPELKMSAQRAFKSYLRSVHLQTNKAVFDVSKLAFREFAASLGLPSAPRIRFTQGGEVGRQKLRQVKNQSRQAGSGLFEEEEEEEEIEQGEEDGDSEEEDDLRDDEEESAKRLARTLQPQRQQQQQKKKLSKVEKLLKKKPQGATAAGAGNSTTAFEDEADDDFLVVAANRTSEILPHTSNDDDEQEGKHRQRVRAKMASKPLKLTDALEVKGKVRPTRVVFDDDTGEALDPFADVAREKETNPALDKHKFVSTVAKRLRAEDASDRENNRMRVKQARLDRKARARREGGDDDGERVAVLGGGSEDGEGPGSPSGDDLEAQALSMIQSSRGRTLVA